MEKLSEINIENALNKLRPVNFGERGMAFWEAMYGNSEKNPSRLALLAEICRLLDTLDQIDQTIRGLSDALIEKEFEIDGNVVLVQIKIEKILVERRTTDALMRQMIKTLDDLDTEVDAIRRRARDERDPAQPVADEVDDLQARRRKRLGG